MHIPVTNICSYGDAVRLLNVSNKDTEKLRIGLAATYDAWGADGGFLMSLQVLIWDKVDNYLLITCGRLIFLVQM